MKKIGQYTSRQSNMELLRIVAIFLVLLDHAGFMSTGVPRQADAIGAPGGTIVRFLVMGLAIVCVNLFVVLSGWFGIKARRKSFFSIIFQTAFYSVLVFAIVAYVNPKSALSRGGLQILILDHSGAYWFVKAYIGLYILSPALNGFIARASQRQLKLFLIAFYAFQTIYGWLLMDSTEWIGGGYSAFSFIGLYVLAAFVRKNKDNIIVQKWTKYSLVVYFGIAVLMAVTAWIVTRMGLPIAGRLFTYTNPLVIGQAVMLLLYFSKLRIQSNFINLVASSSLAVYLLGCNELVLRPHFRRVVRELYQTQSVVTFPLTVLLFFLGIFALAVLVDQIRKKIWAIICNVHTSRSSVS